MNISIEVTKNLLDYLDRKVKLGFYKSRSEVVREAIREMIQKDFIQQMEAKGLTIEDLMKEREKVAGELVKEKYRGRLSGNSRH